MSRTDDERRELADEFGDKALDALAGIFSGAIVPAIRIKGSFGGQAVDLVVTPELSGLNPTQVLGDEHGSAIPAQVEAAG